jgi:hypothetical protein
MSKIRRGGYIFISWKGDHGPRHAHVYRNGRFIVKWDLENNVAMNGVPSKKVLNLLAELQSEGLI